MMKLLKILTTRPDVPGTNRKPGAHFKACCPIIPSPRRWLLLVVSPRSNPRPQIWVQIREAAPGAAWRLPGKIALVEN
jgi:hypothetical protein